MKPIKCENCEKFYDGDKYEICPHCKGEPIGKTKKDVTVKPHPITESQHNREEPEQHTEKKEHTKKENHIKDKFKWGIKKKGELDEKPEIIISDDIDEKADDNEKAQEADGFEKSTSIMKETSENNNDNAFGESEEAEKSELTHRQKSEEKSKEGQSVSLAEVIKQTESTSNDKTVAFYNFSNDVEPVVGWIVCVKGEYMGEGFPLKSGRNNIGRSLSMDIALAKEKSVSREKHAAIVFEPHQKKFFIQGGESSGLTYVNDELVMMFRELSDYDVITLGESKFIFIHFVGDRFSWEDYT